MPAVPRCTSPLFKQAALIPAIASFLLVALAGCAQSRQHRIDRIDASLARAGLWMSAQQSPDGAWRSATYGFMKDGPSLTPHVVSCMYFLPQGGPKVRQAFDGGVRYLVGLTGDDGNIRADLELIYPVYTAAEASRMVVKGQRTPQTLAARRAWLEYLKSHQLTEDNGWRESDIEYGGWGFALQPPRRPPAGQVRGPWDWSNLTATIYGLAALRSAKVPMDDPRYPRILLFVKRCQNFAENSADADPRYDDGGFFFSPADEMRNKGGVAGRDSRGRTRFHSYGSMTADGLRALLTLGLPRDHPRVVAARAWLEKHFDVKHNPGAFTRTNEDLRDATYYYYAWALAHAFLHLHVRHAQTKDGPVDWAATLADELLSRQQPDGSWSNPWTDAREDDPLVSTPFAAGALAICRRVLSGADLPDASCLPGAMTRPAH